MFIEIKGDRLIRDVQRDFSMKYPYLKIEFFKNGMVRKEHYHPSTIFGSQTRLDDARRNRKEEGVLHLDNLTVTELENALLDRFGLSAQVFRKSGNLWLETTITDHWTLDMQNDHGMEITEIFRARNPDA